jgi:uncharacterized protein DUF5709
MKEEELGLPEDLSPDYEGIPETVDGPPPRAPGQLADEAFTPPRDEPRAVFGRVTAAEEAEGETLDERLRQEEPDRVRPDPERPGRLIEPESGVDQIDTTAEEVAYRAPEPGLALSAEEEAVRLVEDSRKP